MKFLILNTDYPEFLEWLYEKHPGLAQEPYERQMVVRNDSLFGVADFYSRNLRALGHEAWDIHVNNPSMQTAWAREHGIRGREDTAISQGLKKAIKAGRRLGGRVPFRYLKPLLRPMRRAVEGPDYGILEAQVRYSRPDVLLNQAVDTFGSDFLRALKPYVRLMVGQIASPPGGEDFGVYDLVISSLPNFVEYARTQGVPAELHRLAFEPAILPRLTDGGERISVSFVGSLSHHHATRIHLLEHLCHSLEVDLWGQGLESMPAHSSLRSRHHGRAWGIEMYRVLQHSKMTLNHHIEIAGRHANNMRLYEATGVGACLVTDLKDDLHELFEPDREVVTYSRAEDCVERIRYLLEHETERAAIAEAGQRRTFKEHTYRLRMEELAGIVTRYLR